MNLKNSRKETKVEVNPEDIQQSVDGWQERARRLCRVENFDVTVEVPAWFENELSLEELKRLYYKLDLVVQSAKMQAAGMLKGTLKYAEDVDDMDTWLAHIVSEGADQQNYHMLHADFMRRKMAENKEEEEESGQG